MGCTSGLGKTKPILPLRLVDFGLGDRPAASGLVRPLAPNKPNFRITARTAVVLTGETGSQTRYSALGVPCPCYERLAAPLRTRLLRQTNPISGWMERGTSAVRIKSCDELDAPAALEKQSQLGEFQVSSLRFEGGEAVVRNKPNSAKPAGGSGLWRAKRAKRTQLVKSFKCRVSSVKSGKPGVLACGRFFLLQTSNSAEGSSCKTKPICTTGGRGIIGRACPERSEGMPMPQVCPPPTCNCPGTAGN